MVSVLCCLLSSALQGLAKLVGCLTVLGHISYGPQQAKEKDFTHCLHSLFCSGRDSLGHSPCFAATFRKSWMCLQKSYLNTLIFSPENVVRSSLTLQVGQGGSVAW